MKKGIIIKSRTALLSIYGCALLLFLLPACEDEPKMKDTEAYFKNNPYRSDSRVDIPFDSKELTLTPTEIKVTMPDQMFTLFIKGGYSPYNWQVSDDSAGVIWPNSANSDSAVYKAYQVKNNSIVVIDAGGRSASAQVKTEHSVNLEIIPTTAHLPSGSGANIQFVATGGYEPYEWVSTFPALGTVNNNGLYTDLSAVGTSATNIVTVVDSQGSAVSASVVIEP